MFRFDGGGRSRYVKFEMDLRLPRGAFYQTLLRIKIRRMRIAARTTSFHLALLIFGLIVWARNGFNNYIPIILTAINMPTILIWFRIWWTGRRRARDLQKIMYG